MNTGNDVFNYYRSGPFYDRIIESCEGKLNGGMRDNITLMEAVNAAIEADSALILESLQSFARSGIGSYYYIKIKDEGDLTSEDDPTDWDEDHLSDGDEAVD